MSEYLFIQSQDPFTETRVSYQYELAMRLASVGHDVKVLLIQNGVLPARAGVRCSEIIKLVESPVTVIADKFSLEQREIAHNQLHHNIDVGDEGIVIDAMLAKQKVIWN